MPYSVYPNTPPPADYSREPKWATEDTIYDTGDSQSSTTWFRPLYDYRLNYNNAQSARRKQIEDFWNQQKGSVKPFLWVDPKTEHHFVSSAAAGYFVTSRQSRFYTAAESWRVIPASGYFSFISALSGTLTQGVHYAYSQDNGVLSIFSASVNSADSYRWSGTFYRKVRFSRDFRAGSRIWDNYEFTVEFGEVLP